jgi:hypothetical protein
MSFRQVYYTSCEKGLSTGAGFQFNAASPGIAPSTLQSIERLGSYDPPRSAPLRPTPEELEQFPVSLFFHTLNDAGAVLGQSRYIGLMAEGRYGNFFAHTLVSADPYADFFQADRLLPIEAWRSKAWVTTEHDSTVLPELDKMPFGEAIDFPGVQEFLRDPARREILPRYLSAVAEALRSNRRIILIDDNGNVARWIAAASYVLPYHLVLRLTFSTYVQNPYSTDALVTGTTEDSSFNFAPHELEHLFSVFDTKGARFSQIVPDGFGLKSAHLYQQTYGEFITGFPVFVEQVAPVMPVEELEDALSAYCYFENQPLPDVDAVRVLAWSSRYVEALADRDFTDLFGKLAGRGEAETLRAATDFYLATLDSGVAAPSARQIEALYFQLLSAGAGRAFAPALLTETAERLPRRVYRGETAERICREWLRHLKDADGPARFTALLRLGDKTGFVEEENDLLHWLGKNVVGGWLADGQIQEGVRDVSGGGGKSLLEGVAAFLAERVDDRQLFASLGTLIADPGSQRVLTDYAIKTHNLPLYLRLSGARANLGAAAPDRVGVLASQLAAVQTSFKTSITAEIVQTAFDSIWLNQAPTLSEVSRLFSRPLSDHVVRSELPGHLIGSLSFDDEVLTPQQIELIERLKSDEIYKSVDDRAKVAINAYLMALDLQRAPESVDEMTAGSCLEWLTNNGPCLPPIASRLYKVLGRKFIKVDDAQLHARSLPAYVKEASGSFLRGYQAEIEGLSRTRNSHPELARLLRVWVLAARRDRSMESHLRNWIGLILKNHSKRGVEKMEAALDRDTSRVWATTRRRIEQEQQGALGRFFDNIFGGG